MNRFHAALLCASALALPIRAIADPVFGGSPSRADLNREIARAAPLVSPGFQGTPTTPDPPVGSNDGTISNTKFVKGLGFLPVSILGGITATGTSCAGAAPLANSISYINAASAGGAVRLSLTAAMPIQDITNATTLDLLVCPSTTLSAIGTSAAGAGVLLLAGSPGRYTFRDTTHIDDAAAGPGNGSTAGVGFGFLGDGGITGTLTAGGLVVVGPAASSLMMLDSAHRLVAVTLGANIVLSGTTLSATGGGVTGITGITGDATVSGGSGSVAITLASVATAGTYGKVTIDAKGRVLSGGTLSVSDVSGAAASSSLAAYAVLAGPTLSGVPKLDTLPSSGLVGHEIITADWVLAKGYSTGGTSGVTAIGGLNGTIACGTNITCTLGTISAASAAGVSLLGGLNGSIACGTGVSCSGGTLSATGGNSFANAVFTGVTTAGAVTAGVTVNSVGGGGVPTNALEFGQVYKGVMDSSNTFWAQHVGINHDTMLMSATGIRVLYSENIDHSYGKGSSPDLGPAAGTVTTSGTIINGGTTVLVPVASPIVANWTLLGAPFGSFGSTVSLVGAPSGGLEQLTFSPPATASLPSGSTMNYQPSPGPAGGGGGQRAGLYITTRQDGPSDSAQPALLGGGAGGGDSTSGQKNSVARAWNTGGTETNPLDSAFAGGTYSSTSCGNSDIVGVLTGASNTMRISTKLANGVVSGDQLQLSFQTGNNIPNLAGVRTVYASPVNSTDFDIWADSALTVPMFANGSGYTVPAYKIDSVAGPGSGGGYAGPDAYIYERLTTPLPLFSHCASGLQSLAGIEFDMENGPGARVDAIHAITVVYKPQHTSRGISEDSAIVVARAAPSNVSVHSVFTVGSEKAYPPTDVDTNILIVNNHGNPGLVAGGVMINANSVKWSNAAEQYASDYTWHASGKGLAGPGTYRLTTDGAAVGVTTAEGVSYGATNSMLIPRIGHFHYDCTLSLSRSDQSGGAYPDGGTWFLGLDAVARTTDPSPPALPAPPVLVKLVATTGPTATTGVLSSTPIAFAGVKENYAAASLISGVTVAPDQLNTALDFELTLGNASSSVWNWGMRCTNPFAKS